jgi:Leucine-rich repeat (LRR) protein
MQGPIPAAGGQLRSLDLTWRSNLQLPDSISQLTALSSLDLGGCTGLQQLPEGIGQLTALSSLELGGCRGLFQLPEGIGQLTALSSLDLHGCSSLKQLPDSIIQLKSDQPAAMRRVN